MNASSPERFVDARNAKSVYYKRAMKEIVEENICPLCPGQMKWHTKPILKRMRGWFITKSFAPYKNTRHHFIIVPLSHKEKLNELTARDWGAIAALAKWASKKFKVQGGGLALRFGDTRYTGATVRHLHAHLIVPRVVGGNSKTTHFPIG